MLSEVLLEFTGLVVCQLWPYFSMRRPGEQGNAHFWPTREGNFSWKIENIFKGVVRRAPVRVRFQLVPSCFCARATQLIYGWWQSRLDREGFSHPDVSYCFWEEPGEFLCLDCAVRDLLSKWSRWLKTGWWVLFSLSSRRLISFLLCHGLDLFWPSLSLHSAFPLWLKISLSRFFHFKGEEDKHLEEPVNTVTMKLIFVKNKTKHTQHFRSNAELTEHSDLVASFNPHKPLVETEPQRG